MTAKEMSALLGVRGWIDVAGLRVDVRLADAKVAYGRTLVLVRPIAGDGEAWVELARVRFETIVGVAL